MVAVFKKKIKIDNCNFQKFETKILGVDNVELFQCAKFAPKFVVL
jgi:hypothetical protein